jgi:hypothetical protein
LNLSTSLESAGEQLMELSELAVRAGQTLNARDLTNQLVSDSFLRKIISPLSEQHLEHLSDADFQLLINRCPSASTLAHVLREYFYTYVQSNFTRFQQGRRTPTVTKRSDFGDLMHVFYSPYVDIFRCDARFGEHLRNHKDVRNRVASRRGDILQMLRG